MKFHVDTSLNREELERSFSAQIVPAGVKTYYKEELHRRELFVGKWKDGYFWFVYKPRYMYRNSFVLRLGGKTEELPDGRLRIQYRIAKFPAVKLLAAIWCGLLLLIGTALWLMEEGLWAYIPWGMALAGFAAMAYRPAASVERLTRKLWQIAAKGGEEV